jgi:hypothetical protein
LFSEPLFFRSSCFSEVHVLRSSKGSEALKSQVLNTPTFWKNLSIRTSEHSEPDSSESLKTLASEKSSFFKTSCFQKLMFSETPIFRKIRVSSRKGGKPMKLEWCHFQNSFCDMKAKMTHPMTNQWLLDFFG